MRGESKNLVDILLTEILFSDSTVVSVATVQKVSWRNRINIEVPKDFIGKSEVDHSYSTATAS